MLKMMDLNKTWDPVPELDEIYAIMNSLEGKSSNPFFIITPIGREKEEEFMARYRK